jgi:hypothetical protein
MLFWAEKTDLSTKTRKSESTKKRDIGDTMHHSILTSINHFRVLRRGTIKVSKRGIGTRVLVDQELSHFLR